MCAAGIVVRVVDRGGAYVRALPPAAGRIPAEYGKRSGGGGGGGMWWGNTIGDI